MISITKDINVSFSESSTQSVSSITDNLTFFEDISKIKNNEDKTEIVEKIYNIDQAAQYFGDSGSSFETFSNTFFAQSLRPSYFVLCASSIDATPGVLNSGQLDFYDDFFEKTKGNSISFLVNYGEASNEEGSLNYKEKKEVFIEAVDLLEIRYKFDNDASLTKEKKSEEQYKKLIELIKKEIEGKINASVVFNENIKRIKFVTVKKGKQEGNIDFLLNTEEVTKKSKTAFLWCETNNISGFQGKKSKIKIKLVGSELEIDIDNSGNAFATFEGIAAFINGKINEEGSTLQNKVSCLSYELPGNKGFLEFQTQENDTLIIEDIETGVDNYIKFFETMSTTGKLEGTGGKTGISDDKNEYGNVLLKGTDEQGALIIEPTDDSSKYGAFARISNSLFKFGQVGIPNVICLSRNLTTNDSGVLTDNEKLKSIISDFKDKFKSDNTTMLVLASNIVKDVPNDNAEGVNQYPLAEAVSGERNIVVNFTENINSYIDCAVGAFVAGIKWGEPSVARNTKGLTFSSIETDNLSDSDDDYFNENLINCYAKMSDGTSMYRNGLTSQKGSVPYIDLSAGINALLVELRVALRNAFSTGKISFDSSGGNVLYSLLARVLERYVYNGFLSDTTIDNINYPAYSIKLPQSARTEQISSREYPPIIVKICGRQFVNQISLSVKNAYELNEF